MSERPLRSLFRELELYRSVLGGDEELRDPRRNQLVASLRHYQALFSRAPVGHLILDPDGVVLEANAAARELVGGAIEGHPLAIRVATGADDLAIRHHLFEAFSSQRRQSCEIRLRHADKPAMTVRLESMADPYQRMCLTAMIAVEPLPRQQEVLVVEDERLVRIVLRHYLTRAGYDVIEARDVDDALARCHGRRIQLLIADVVLPTSTGPQLAAHLAVSMPDLRVLYISAHPKELLIATRRLEPTDELLQKPFSETDLLAAVRKG